MEQGIISSQFLALAVHSLTGSAELQSHLGVSLLQVGTSHLGQSILAMLDDYLMAASPPKFLTICEASSFGQDLYQPDHGVLGTVLQQGVKEHNHTHQVQQVLDSVSDQVSLQEHVNCTTEAQQGLGAMRDQGHAKHALPQHPAAYISNCIPQFPVLCSPVSCEDVGPDLQHEDPQYSSMQLAEFPP